MSCSEATTILCPSIFSAQRHVDALKQTLSERQLPRYSSYYRLRKSGLDRHPNSTELLTELSRPPTHRNFPILYILELSNRHTRAPIRSPRRPSPGGHRRWSLDSDATSARTRVPARSQTFRTQSAVSNKEKRVWRSFYYRQPAS